NNSYDPMRKQGAILLGNGGDNSNGSQGTFYEGAMTAAGTFPNDATDQLIQANVVAAKYAIAPVTIVTPSGEVTTGLRTVSPRSSQDLTVMLHNSTSETWSDAEFSVTAPPGWSASTAGSGRASSATIPRPLTPGMGVGVRFTVTSGAAPFNGDLIGTA